MIEEPILTLRSIVKPSLNKMPRFLRGSYSGALGVALWLYGGIFLSTSSLTFWGWPIFLIGLILIAWGLLPYRKLTRLENNPNEIILTDLEELYFSMQGTSTFKIALENIEEMAYLDDNSHYGIGLWIKSPKTKHIIVLHPTLDFQAYLKDCQKRYFCDVFFPNFSKRSFKELEELYKNI